MFKTFDDDAEALSPIDLNRPLARGKSRHLGDVMAVADGLDEVGAYDKGRHGNPPLTAELLFRAIERFQNDNGLKVDGAMAPGGPTVQLLNARLGRRGGDEREDGRIAVGSGSAIADRDEVVTTFQDDSHPHGPRPIDVVEERRRRALRPPEFRMADDIEAGRNQSPLQPTRGQAVNARENGDGTDVERLADPPVRTGESGDGGAGTSRRRPIDELFVGMNQIVREDPELLLEAFITDALSGLGYDPQRATRRLLGYRFQSLDPDVDAGVAEEIGATLDRIDEAERSGLISPELAAAMALRLGGHHIVARNVYNSFQNLSPEARRAFNRMVTGRGLTNAHRGHSTAHRASDAGTLRIMTDWLRQNGRTASSLSAADARRIGLSILTTRDGDVRGFLQQILGRRYSQRVRAMIDRLNRGGH